MSKYEFDVRVSELGEPFWNTYHNGVHKSTSSAGQEAYHQFKMPDHPFYSTFWLEFKDGKPSHVGEDRYKDDQAGRACKTVKHKIRIKETA